MGSEPKTSILTVRLAVLAALVILIAVLMKMVGASIFDVQFKDVEQTIISDWVWMVLWFCGLAFGVYAMWRKDRERKHSNESQISN